MATCAWAQYDGIVSEGTFAFDEASNFNTSTGIVEGKTVAVSSNAGSNSQSKLITRFSVPEGQTGVLSWDGAVEATAPNGLAVFLNDVTPDGFPLFNGQSMDPQSAAATYYLEPGDYTLEFYFFISNDHYQSGSATTPERCYVYDLSLACVNEGASIDTEAIDFGKVYYDKLPVQRSATVNITNIGESPLSITSIEGSGIFTAKALADEAASRESIAVEVSCAIGAVGTETGTVTIATTAGNFEIPCTIEVLALPYDYSPIVKEGDFSFNTSIDYPFVVEGNTAYNSTSDQSYDECVSSFLEVSFLVPDGQVGQLSWTGFVATYWGYEIMGDYQWEDALLVSIDGGEERIFDGEQDASSTCYGKADLTFSAGQHTVKFDYVKTQYWPYYNGDRFTISDLALELSTPEAYKAVISATEVEMPEVTNYRRSRAYVTIENQGIEPLTINSVAVEAPFTVVVRNDGAAMWNCVELEIRFEPVEAGTFTGKAQISTSAGDFTVDCTAIATEIEGRGIYFEDFEGDLADWTFVDNDLDGDCWTVTTAFANDAYTFSANEGRTALISTSWNPDTYLSSMPDNYAISPEITLPADSKSWISYFVGLECGMDETLEVLIGESADPSQMTSLSKNRYQSNAWGEDIWEEAITEIPTEWNGKTVRLALRHCDSNGGMWIRIDDMLVLTTGSSAIPSVAAESAPQDVYNMQGILMMRSATPEAIRTLPRGLYIIGRKKALVK